MMELPSIQDTREITRWNITNGPRDERFEETIRLGLPVEFCLENSEVMKRAKMSVYAVQPLEIHPGMSFTGGRLWCYGGITLAWGRYDPKRREGELWVMPLPDSYTTILSRRNPMGTSFPGLPPLPI